MHIDVAEKVAHRFRQVEVEIRREPEEEEEAEQDRQQQADHAEAREIDGHDENLVGVLFLGVFAFNLLIMAVDFPRFSVVGLLLAILFGLFFLLWLAAYFHFDLAESVRNLLGNVYVHASSGFYFS